MVVHLKLFLIPIVGAWSLLYDSLHLSTNPSSILAYAGIAAFIATAFTVGRYRETISTQERTIQAATAERDIEVERAARLAVEKSDVEKRVSVLEAQPNLTTHALLLEKLVERLDASDAYHKEAIKGLTEGLHEIAVLLREIPPVGSVRHSSHA